MSSSHPLAGTNLAVLVGILSRDPEFRTLPSGNEVVGLELTVRRAGTPAESVPVAWHLPPAWVLDLDAGEELVVVGRVQRRFFKAGGITQSRTEVIATDVVPSRKRAAAARAIAMAGRQLDEPAVAT
jgi:single-strand DNA-binding protein